MAGSKVRSWGRLTLVATIVLAALLLDFIGLGVGVSIAQANSDLTSLAWVVTYVLVSAVAPVLVAWIIRRRRAWTMEQTLLAAGGISLLVNIVLSPVGLSILAV
jgi:hypothetical protein